MWYLVKCNNLKALEAFPLADGVEIYFPVVGGQPLYDNLLFVHANKPDFQRLMDSHIPGLFPIRDLANKDFAQFSDSNISMLRKILDSQNDDIIIHDKISSSLLSGDTVLVTDGPFVGLQGKQAKYKHQNRVFVEIDGLGCFGTSYVPKGWMRKVGEAV